MTHKIEGTKRSETGRGQTIFFSILSGVLLALAFPKFNLFWLAWIALIPFFLALKKTENSGEALLCAFSFGIFFFGIHLFWVNTLFQFAGWWVVVGWGMFVLFQTLFIILFVVLLRVIRVTNPLLVALLWIVVEWLRSLGPFGVTVGDLGYSQVQLLPLIQVASFVSVYGVSFLVVLVNAAIVNLAAILRSPHENGSLKTSATFLIIVLLSVLGCFAYGQWLINRASRIEYQGSKLKIALIQPNIAQKYKLDPSEVLRTFDIHEKMSQQAAQQKPDIIIWPETSIFDYLLRDPVLFPRLKNLTRNSKAWLIFGTPRYDERGDAFNSVVSLSPIGKIVSRYDKERLVPFGEYLPFRKILYPLLGKTGYYDEEFVSNPEPVLVSAGEVKIATAICFESTFPDLVKERVGRGAAFILSVTNDAWFDNSSAPYFHLNSGIFRAIENRKYFVQVGNTGISAVIDPFGRVLKKTELNQQEILTFEVPLS